MFDSQCYLCGKPGKFEKLFRGCKHESACYSCLRNCYVIQAQKVLKYPLQCFHPECNLVVRTPHMERFVQSKQELETYHHLSATAKMNKLRLGDNWQEVMEIVREALGCTEICRCPECKMLITKNGGCDHMSCICGASFNWYFHRRSIEESCDYIQKKYSRMNLRHSGGASATKAPALRLDDDFVGDCDDYSVLNELIDFFEADMADEADQTAVEDCTRSATPTVSDLYSVPSDIDSVPSLEAAQASTVVDEPQTEWEQDFHVLELASAASDDSWSHFDVTSESTIATDDFEPFSQATWEEVSEISSVVSFHSTTGMSFLEVARETSNQPIKGNSWKKVSKVSKPRIQLQTITEHRKSMASAHESDDDEDQMFDADFMLDGAKFTRGGKQKFMFKHQPRRKYHRRDRLRSARRNR